MDIIKHKKLEMGENKKNPIKHCSPCSKILIMKVIDITI